MRQSRSSTGDRPHKVKAPHAKSRWRRWLLEPLSWLAGLVFLLVAGEMVVGVLLPLPFGAEMAAAVAYSDFMVVMIFFPGRANRGYNPFGAIARRAAGPLLLTHIVALLVLMPVVVLALYVRSRYAPRWLFASCIVFGVCLSLWQAVRSSTLLEESEQALGRELSTEKGRESIGNAGPQIHRAPLP